MHKSGDVSCNKTNVSPKETGRTRIRQKLQDIGVRLEAPKMSLRFSALQCGKSSSTDHDATKLFSYDITKLNLLHNILSPDGKVGN